MKTLFCLIACLIFVACGSDSQQEDAQSAADSHQEAPVELAVQDMPVEAGTYTVACGCSIESVGHCGNYIDLAGNHVEIANSEELGLGGMEWCGKSDVTAEASGEVKDGKFVAASLVIQ